jgi:hypothetical protein
MFVACTVLPVTVAPEIRVVNTPETALRFDACTVSPVIVAPETLVVKVPEIPVILLA